MSLRVVNLGLPKTGTTTLARALRSSGLKVADHRIRPYQSADATLHKTFVGKLIYQGYFETGDPAVRLSEFDAISEMSCLRAGRSLWPQTDFGVIDALRRHNPDVKFVATRRTSRDVSQSMLAWSDLGIARLPAAAVPGLPPGFGETGKEREVWIDAHYAHLATVFRGDPDFLELDVAAPDAQQRLAAHLGLEIAGWGRANKGRHAHRRRDSAN